MRKCFVLSVGCMLLAAPVLCAAGSGPEVIDLKERFKVEGGKKAVNFPHHKHQTKLACASCHEDAAGGGALKFELANLSGVANDFHKNFCWPCHEEMKVPKGKSCSNCHK